MMGRTAILTYSLDVAVWPFSRLWRVANTVAVGVIADMARLAEIG